MRGEAITTVVYDIPLSAAGAPYQMATANVGAWSQRDVPTDATAVFPADARPAGNSSNLPWGEKNHHNHYFNFHINHVRRSRWGRY